MDNIVDYMRWRGDLSYEQSSFCPVDFLIYAELAYARYEQLPDQGLGRSLAELKPLLYPDPLEKIDSSVLRNRFDLWQVLPGCPRFSTIRLVDFAAHFAAREEVQFSASLFEAGDACVVAFRGTDSTLVGWKEDFNMSFETPVPSQLEAVQYLARAVRGRGKLYLTGHSKGGNLALYAAAMSPEDIQEHIAGVYVFDGPGVSEDVLAGEGFERIRSRVHSYIPESSIIGLLMETCEHPTVVVSDSVSIQQHDPFYWHVLGTRFVEAEDTTLSSRFIDRTLHGFLHDCDVERRKGIVDVMYQLLALTGAKSIRELPRGIALHLGEIRKALAQLPAEDRALLSEVLRILVGSGGETVRELFGEWRSRRT